MAQIKSGKAAVTKGSNIVYGVGTNWVGNVEAGWIFKRQNSKIDYTIASVDLALEEIHLSEAYAEDTSLEESYVIITDFEPVLQLPLLGFKDIDWIPIYNNAMRKLGAAFSVLLDGVAFQGTWNAATNSPEIPVASEANIGWMYKVATAGTTAIDGVSLWNVGDTLISNGIIWHKIAKELSLTANQLEQLTSNQSAELHYHNADRARANHTGTQSANTVVETESKKFVSGLEKSKWNSYNERLNHVGTQSPDTIDETASKRFVSDFDKARWDSAITGLYFQGLWDASTNTPAIPPADPTMRGWFWKVGTEGDTEIDGINDWLPGDEIYCTGTSYQRVQPGDAPAFHAMQHTPEGFDPIPLATSTTAGLMSTDNFVKLLGFKPSAIFIQPNQPNPFPLDAIWYSTSSRVLLAPTITKLSNDTILVDVDVDKVINVFDEYDVNLVTLSATSSDTSKVPLSRISFSGSGYNRSMHIQGSDILGSSLITVTATNSDGLTASTSFLYDVVPLAFVITSSVTGSHGSIDPAGNVTVGQGGTLTFSGIPDFGYGVDTILIDGTTTLYTDVYTFNDVQTDHTIAMTFAEAHTIVASVIGNGTITPSGSVGILNGRSKTFTFAPLVGYQLADVIIDGVSQGYLASHEFTDVTGDHTISATFTEIPVLVQVANVAVTDMNPTTLRISWSDIVGETEYRVYWSDQVGDTTAQMIKNRNQKIIVSADTTYTDFTVDTDVTYKFTVVPYNANGEGPASDVVSGLAAAWDITPDQFTFTDQTSVTPSTLTMSNIITITGIEYESPLSVSGGEYQLNGGTWTASSGVVNPSDTVRVRHTSSASGSTATNTTLTINGVTDTFTTTTYVVPVAPTGLALSVAPTSLTASWNDLSNEASYNIYYSTSSNLDATTYDGATAYPGTPDATAGVLTATANTVTKLISGLTTGVVYYVRVAGVGGVTGPLCAAVSATTGAVLLGFETGLDGFTVGGTLVSRSTTVAKAGSYSIKVAGGAPASWLNGLYKNVSFPASGVFTLECSYYIAALPTAASQYMIMSVSQNFPAIGWWAYYITIDQNGLVTFRNGDDPVTVAAQTPINNWYRLVVTLDVANGTGQCKSYNSSGARIDHPVGTTGTGTAGNNYIDFATAHGNIVPGGATLEVGGNTYTLVSYVGSYRFTVSPALTASFTDAVVSWNKTVTLTHTLISTNAAVIFAGYNTASGKDFYIDQVSLGGL